MNLRHAAALALVGWHLMVPPWIATNRFDATAPLPRWKYSKSFDSATACGRYQAAAANYLFANKEKYPDKVVEYNIRLYQASLCIATDDPRLKEK